MQALMTSQDRTDDLIRKAQTGDRDAFGELFESFRERLLERIRARSGRRVKPELDPEDVLQETFLRAFETVRLFAPKGEDSFFRWLSAIAEHLILNASRKRQPDPLEVKHEPASSSVSPTKGLRRKERFDRLEQAVQGLTEDQRRVVLMARVDGLTARQIALRLGKTEEAVRQLLARALKRLKRTMGDTESLHLPDKFLGKEGPHDA